MPGMPPSSLCERRHCWHGWCALLGSPRKLTNWDSTLRQSCQSGEVYVTFSDAAAAKELVKHAQDMLRVIYG